MTTVYLYINTSTKKAFCVLDYVLEIRR